MLLFVEFMAALFAFFSYFLSKKGYPLTHSPPAQSPAQNLSQGRLATNVF